MEKHWLDEDFGVMKVDMKNAFNQVSAMLSSQSVLNISQNSYLGSAGAMGNTHISGIPWVA